MKKAFIHKRLYEIALLAAILPSAALGAEKAAHSSKTSLDWAGAYKAELPCADCQKLETIIILNKNNSYQMQSVYKGKSKEVFEKKGNFSWNKDGNVIALKMDKDTSHYRVTENHITQLDKDGKPITGEHADLYVFNRQPDAQLRETYWRLLEIEGKPIAATSKEAHIILKEKDSRIVGTGGCNRMMGSYELKEPSQITISKIAGTMMACLKGMDVEQQFLKTLPKAESYSIKGNQLLLNPSAKAPLARFEAVYLR
jgi:copper homeostasis protein (lipoprotein)